MNSREKGNKAERKCVRILEDAGYLTYRVPASKMYQKNQDIFHLWDVLAVKDHETLLIQVKCNRTKSMKLHKEFAKKHPQITCEFWVWVDYRGFERKRL